MYIKIRLKKKTESSTSIFSFYVRNYCNPNKNNNNKSNATRTIKFLPKLVRFLGMCRFIVQVKEIR